MSITPNTLAPVLQRGQLSMLQRAQAHVATLSAPELLSFLGTLDSEAARFERTDDVHRIFREVASIARTELSRKSPGTYVTLAILK